MLLVSRLGYVSKSNNLGKNNLKSSESNISFERRLTNLMKNEQTKVLSQKLGLKLYRIRSAEGTNVLLLL